MQSRYASCTCAPCDGRVAYVASGMCRIAWLPACLQTLFNAALKGVEQFLREARSLSALRHPHVVQFLGVSIEAGKYQVRV